MPRQPFRETRYRRPTAFDAQANLFVWLRRQWVNFKNSKFFNRIKHSDLNPYHSGLEKIVADTPQQEQEIAREKGLGQYIDKNGVRCLVNFDGRPQEEFEKTGKVLRKNGDVTDRIPRDKDGKLDLMAEEPILIGIIPLEGISLTGHACMQYKDRVINRVLIMNTEPLYPQYQELADYYFIYPSQLGIKPKDIIRVMDKYNIKNGGKRYDIFTNNCAKNVADVLKKLGVKDINFIGPDKVVSLPTPGNNPYHFGIEDWCMRHGVPVTQEEVAFLYKYNDFEDANAKAARYSKIRMRHKQYKDHLINKQTQSKLSKLRKKVTHTADAVLHTKLEKKKIPNFAKYVEQKISDVTLGKDK